MSAHTHTTHIGTRTSCCDESRSDFRIMVTKFLRSSSEWLFKWEGKTQMEFCKSFTRRTISFIKRTNPRLTTNDDQRVYVCHPDSFPTHLTLWSGRVFSVSSCTTTSPSSALFSLCCMYLFHLKNVYATCIVVILTSCPSYFNVFSPLIWFHPLQMLLNFMHDGKYASRVQLQTRTHKLWLRLGGREIWQWENSMSLIFFLTILWFQVEWEWREERESESIAMDS